MLFFVAFFDMNFYDFIVERFINRSYDHFFLLSLVEKLMLVTSDTEKKICIIVQINRTDRFTSLVRGGSKGHGASAGAKVVW